MRNHRYSFRRRENHNRPSRHSQAPNIPPEVLGSFGQPKRENRSDDNSSTTPSRAIRIVRAPFGLIIYFPGHTTGQDLLGSRVSQFAGHCLQQAAALRAGGHDREAGVIESFGQACRQAWFGA